MKRYVESNGTAYEVYRENNKWVIASIFHVTDYAVFSQPERDLNIEVKGGKVYLVKPVRESNKAITYTLSGINPSSKFYLNNTDKFIIGRSNKKNLCPVYKRKLDENGMPASKRILFGTLKEDFNRSNYHV